MTVVMTKARMIDIPGIGTVLCRHNRRARRIIVSVSALRGVRVTLPASQPYSSAAGAVIAHKDWITRNLERIGRDRKEAQALRDKFQAIGLAEAKKALISRLQELAEKHGFTYCKVSVRNQTTRWGSCSPRNNISLNVKLVCLPDELRDYVILHELVHTRVRNHSLKFHTELDKYAENARLLSRRLRKIGLQIL